MDDEARMGPDQSTRDAQRVVSDYFDADTTRWEEFYEQDGARSIVYRQRLELALDAVDGLGLPPGAPVLEVGCGAGWNATRLATRGLTVSAVDASPRMVEITRQRVSDAGCGHAVTVDRADAHELPFPPASFELLIALGVIPWLHSPAGAVRNWATVVRPGGHVLLSADNRMRLIGMLDPYYSPVLRRLRDSRLPRPHRQRRPVEDVAHVTMHGAREFRQLVTAAGLQVVTSETFGFSEFTFRDRPLLPDSASVALHRALQAGSRRLRPLRALGAQSLILARKPR